MKRPYISNTLARLEDEKSFNRWLAAHRASMSSQQTDLPSSHITPRTSLVSKDTAQLFVIIDTCSIVSFRNDFIDYITHLKKLYYRGRCPIRFIISLVVLEELDKCNRRAKRKVKADGVVEEKPTKLLKSSDRPDGTTELKDFLEIATKELSDRTNNINQIRPEPPRMFMRFIEEEMRTSDILISELDPFRRTKLKDGEKNFEIVNKDDRILECCLRTRAFVSSLCHHPDTKVVLISEDNVFKSKATTFEIPSYRWREFQAKFKNFGLEHYVATPQYPITSTSKAQSNNISTDDSIMIVKEVINLS